MLCFLKMKLHTSLLQKSAIRTFLVFGFRLNIVDSVCYMMLLNVVVHVVAGRCNYVDSVFSSYLMIYCGSCSMDLGRCYLTTPHHLDEIRQMYTISVDSIDQ